MNNIVASRCFAVPRVTPQPARVFSLPVRKTGPSPLRPIRMVEGKLVMRWTISADNRLAMNWQDAGDTVVELDQRRSWRAALARLATPFGGRNRLAA